jgi:hypothetical protein
VSISFIGDDAQGAHDLAVVLAVEDMLRDPKQHLPVVPLSDCIRHFAQGGDERLLVGPFTRL